MPADTMSTSAAAVRRRRNHDRAGLIYARNLLTIRGSRGGRIEFPPDGQFVALAEPDEVYSDDVFQLGQIVDGADDSQPKFAVFRADRRLSAA